MNANIKPESKQSALPRARRMRLAAVVRGKQTRPMRVMVFGPDGVGKSTFAANAPKPIFVGAEDGTSQLNVVRFPEPHNWLDVRDAIAELECDLTHDYETLVIDTLDWLEPLCWKHVCATKRDKFGKPMSDIQAFGYGKGFDAALDEWRVLLADLDRLRAARGMHVVLLAHSWIKTFKNPADDDYDRYEIKLHQKAAGLIKEWTDVYMFAIHETLTHEKDGRVRGISTGARVLHTQRTAAWDAKNRYDLPETLPLDWDAFADAVASHRPADPAKLKARIAELLESVGDDLRARVNAALSRAQDDAAQLARIANKLQAEVSLNGGQQT